MGSVGDLVLTGWVNDSDPFPDPRQADAYGLVAWSYAVTPKLLLKAYEAGIFPWSDRPARWFCPDPRAVFEWKNIRISRRLARTVRQGRFEVTFDLAFRQVVLGCARHHKSTWISAGMVDAYTEIHQQGFAHSVEVWREDRLVGGLYGVLCGGAFAGESMFHFEPDASKVGFVHLVEQLRALGVTLFDAQVLTPHTLRLGATEISREQFLDRLEAARELRVKPRLWRTP